MLNQIEVEINKAESRYSPQSANPTQEAACKEAFLTGWLEAAGFETDDIEEALSDAVLEDMASYHSAGHMGIGWS